MNTQVKKTTTRSALKVTGVYASKFQKEGTLTAEVKQTSTVTSEYPAMSVSNNRQDSLYAIEDFNLKPQVFKHERTDVAFLTVPAGKTVEIVQKDLAANPNACLYQVISNKPILSTSQTQAIDNNLTTIEAIAESQLVRYGADRDGHKKGEILLDSLGRPQYKATYFSGKNRPDEDNRSDDPQDFFITQSIRMELEEVPVIGQNI